MYAKSRKQLADLYGFSPRTFTNRLKAAGIDLASRKLICPAKQIEIFAYFGVPFVLPEEEAALIAPRVQAYRQKKRVLT